MPFILKEKIELQVYSILAFFPIIVQTPLPIRKLFVHQ